MSDVSPSLPDASLSWKAGIHMSRRHLLLYARLQRATARAVVRVYGSDTRILKSSKRKMYRARTARILAQDLRRMERGR